MSAIVTLPRLELLQSIVDFVNSLVTDTVQIGLQNGVPMPPSPCVILTDIGAPLVGLNVETYDSDAETRTNTPTREFKVQVDCYGTPSHETAEAIATMWRSDYPSSYLPDGSSAAYASDPKQLTFVNSEAQYELRWSFEIVLSYTPSVTVPQQFFTSVSVGVHNVDAEYPLS